MTQMHGCLAKMEMNTRHREALALASRIRQAQSAEAVHSPGISKHSTRLRTGSLAALLRRLFQCEGLRLKGADRRFAAECRER
jgi:hypothetical protein